VKVARLHGVGDIRLADESAPDPESGKSLVRVTAVGLCGSDLHWFGEGGIGDAALTKPLVLGHEIGGVIEGGPEHGRRVAVDPAQPCGQCEECHDGNRNLCRLVRFAGHGGHDGGLRELLSWPTELLRPVPDSFTDADIAMLEPLGVALHAMDLAHVTVGNTVAVVGCGPIGLCAVQLARVAGCTQVVAVEPLRHRREAAARFGAHAVLDASDEHVRTALDEATRGRGVDAVLEVAGSDAAVALSVYAARSGGRVVLAGIPDADTTTFPAGAARRKGLTLKLARRMKEMYPRAIRLVEQGRVDVRSLVTHTFALQDVREAFQVAQRREGLKVMVVPTAVPAESGS
jgi:L-iditol 2-dehydrogenase